jgi:hypothetical protein
MSSLEDSSLQASIVGSSYEIESLGMRHPRALEDSDP